MIPASGCPGGASPAPSTPSPLGGSTCSALQVTQRCAVPARPHICMPHIQLHTFTSCSLFLLLAGVGRTLVSFERSSYPSQAHAFLRPTHAHLPASHSRRVIRHTPPAVLHGTIAPRAVPQATRVLAFTLMVSSWAPAPRPSCVSGTSSRRRPSRCRPPTPHASRTPTPPSQNLSLAPPLTPHTTPAPPLHTHHHPPCTYQHPPCIPAHPSICAC